jgi:hypothetical protein
MAILTAFPVKGAGANDLSQSESPSLYSIDRIDQTLKAGTDGGYEFRRNRTTRPERKVITTGFIGLPHADYLKLDAFYETHTQTTAFTYYDYVHGVTRQVRFDEFKPDYVGVGQNRMWTIKIKMSEI